MSGQFHERAFLFFDGIHYDAIAQTLAPTAPPSADVKLFPTSPSVLDDAVLGAMRPLHDVRSLSK